MSLETPLKKLVEASSNLLRTLNTMTTDEFSIGKDQEARQELGRVLNSIKDEDSRKPRIVIKIEGGVPREVGSDKPVDLLILDYDVEGTDEDDLIEVDGEQCFFHEYYNLGKEKDWVDRNWVEEE